jgi:tetratricopeptide (TPR) repeat protein
MIIIQFIRSKDTEKVTKRIQEELLPEMLKMRSHIEEKLDLDNIISADAMEEKNPEWKRMFEDTPGLYDKMEEFSNLQQEGADVFLGAFSMLKFFDFFQDLYAWFLPFYKENPVIKDAFEGLAANSNTDSLLEGIESTGFMCNSDKYSFCLNVKNLPQQQKDMLSNMFNMELKAMNEMREDEELINSSSKDKFIITQYFQDLYRFFKLHPKKYEFFDVFKLKSTLHKTTFFDVLVNDKNVLRNIGEFYFEKEHYEEAISIFKELIEVQESFELFEKIGYSYQMMGDYQRALKYYKNAELFDKNREWILKKIAYCYRKLQNYDRALEYYKEAEKLDPENMYTQTFMGNVHVDRKEYEEALKYYFKVEYMAKDNYRVHRPISWCSFMLGKLDTAEKYLVKVIEKGANKHDYMNMGHIKWCMGDKKGAIENYKQSLEKSKKDFKWFAKTINIDRPHLLNNNIDPLEIPLMIDYLRVNA